MSMFAHSDPDDCGVEAVSPLVRTTVVRVPVNITGCSFSLDGRSLALTRGDGKVSLASGLDGLPGPDEAGDSEATINPRLVTVDAHDVAATRIVSVPGGYVTGGQDGRLMFICDDGADIRLLWDSGGDWIEALVIHHAKGLIGAAAGGRVVVLSLVGSVVGESQFEDTISGLAFDANASRIAVSHYDGASVLALPGCSTDLKLEWRGWHLGVSWSPCGRYLVTTTQEKELHVWDLVTMNDYRIGGYQRKVMQMAWTADGQTMVCSGADVVTAWSFAGAGPNGRPPVEIGFVFGGTVSSVAASPVGGLVAGGFSTGNVLVGATGKGEAVVAQARTGEQVTSLAWSPCGRRLGAGGMRGRLSLFTLAADLRVK